MKRCILIFFAMIVFSSVSNAESEYIPTWELLRDTDLVVVGTLRSVSERTIDNIEHSTGIIDIEQVLSGKINTSKNRSLRSGDKISIRWQKLLTVVCPRLEHKGAQNRSGIWLLKVEESGNVLSDNSGRYKYISGLKEIKAELRKAPTRKSGKVVKLISDEPVANLEIIDVQTSNEVFFNREIRMYYPLRAVLVALFFTGLYFVLYRSRFKLSRVI